MDIVALGDIIDGTVGIASFWLPALGVISSSISLLVKGILNIKSKKGK